MQYNNIWLAHSQEPWLQTGIRFETTFEKIKVPGALLGKLVLTNPLMWWTKECITYPSPNKTMLPIRNLRISKRCKKMHLPNLSRNMFATQTHQCDSVVKCNLANKQPPLLLWLEQCIDQSFPLEFRFCQSRKFLGSSHGTWSGQQQNATTFKLLFKTLFPYI